jgi:hypothetical protein
MVSAVAPCDWVVGLFEPVAQLAERFARCGVGHVGVDVHRQRDAAMAKDLHCDARVDVQLAQSAAPGGYRPR